MIHKTRISKKERQNFIKEVKSLKLAASIQFFNSFNRELYDDIVKTKINKALQIN